MFNRKLNLKYYLLLNLFFLTIICLPYLQQPKKIMGFLIVFVGVTLNQIFLIKGVSMLISSSIEQNSEILKRKRKVAVIYLILKLIILILAFTLSVQFIRNEIKMALLFYILTFISLYISLSKGLKHDE